VLQNPRRTARRRSAERQPFSTEVRTQHSTPSVLASRPQRR
jgi:hypothetical protein